MRVSRLFGKTLRDDPAEAELDSHRLMLRAGLISQTASGLYSYLPLAWRSLRKIKQIIREEMDLAGGQEVRLSTLQPREMWQKSGRDALLGPDMFRLEDRRGRPLVLAPTHEELLTEIVKINVNSYRDLPVNIYQIQTKFRDEPRPRGGLIRVREFDMKDAYSFDADEAGLDISYDSMVDTYRKIYARCGLSTFMVEADSGAIGGKDSQEFIAFADLGEDTVLMCEECSYAANVEKAAFIKPTQAVETPGLLEGVHTPGVKTIEELAEYLDIDTVQILKSVFYMADDEIVVVTIRGDLDVNDVKLSNLLGSSELRLAVSDEVERVGLVPGYGSPVGRDDVKVVADDSVQLGSNFVAGANRSEHHLINVNYPRDFRADVISDIALAQKGYACPTCESRLVSRRGIEVGHVFKLGTKYSDVIGAKFLDSNGARHPIMMGCYGIGVGRLLAAVLEQSHDDKGIIFPAAIAPYDVWLTALNLERGEVAVAAESLYKSLRASDVQVLYDDREESAGVKLNDSDLLGIPIRVVVSQRNLRQNVVEIKKRNETSSTKFPTNEIVERIKWLIANG